MGDSVPSLKEIGLRIMVFFIYTYLSISFWIWIYDNINTIIEILVKNIWITLLLLIIVWIIPSIFVYFIANSLNKNVSSLRSLGASSLPYIILYILVSPTIFALFPYMNQILVIPILFIVAIILLIVFIIIYARMFNVNWIDAFKIASTYAFISIVIISISIVYIIIFNLG